MKPNLRHHLIYVNKYDAKKLIANKQSIDYLRADIVPISESKKETLKFKSIIIFKNRHQILYDEIVQELVNGKFVEVQISDNDPMLHLTEYALAGEWIAFSSPIYTLANSK